VKWQFLNSFERTKLTCPIPDPISRIFILSFIRFKLEFAKNTDAELGR
jgi:hypothetical protein